MNYKRVILKLSGETLQPESKKGCFDPERVDEVAKILKKVHDHGAQLGIVIGGGNIWRGRFTKEMNGANADQMGMLATVINALCVQDALERLGVKAVVFTAQEMNRFARLYTRSAAIEALESGAIVLLAGGSGNPYFTTDTAAALRAAEIGVDIALMAKNIDGVYDKDPRKFADAKKYDEITYSEILAKKLGVIDLTAASLCMEKNLPVLLFQLGKGESIASALCGESVGTVIRV